MAFKVERAGRDDLPEMAAIWSRAMEADTFWKAMIGPKCTFEEECAYTIQSLEPRFGAGTDLGACQTWKIVDEGG